MRVSDLLHLAETHELAQVQMSSRVVHVLVTDTNEGLCGKFATRNVTKIRSGNNRDVCGNCAKRVPAAPEPVHYQTQENARLTEEVNGLIDKVRNARRAGDAEGAQTAAAEADKALAGLPPAMRGLLSASLMEAQQTELGTIEPEPHTSEQADEGLADTGEGGSANGNGDETSEGNEPSSEMATVGAAPTEDDNEPEEPSEKDAMAKLIVLGAKRVLEAVRNRNLQARGIASVILDMRTRILDKDGDVDLRAATDEAKGNSQRIYDLVQKSIKAAPDAEDLGLISEMKSVKRSVQTAMVDEVVRYVRSLDASPEEFADKFARAREEFPELSPSEAVWAYYEKAGKPLPTATRAELARAKRRLERESKVQVTPKDETPDETQETGDGPAEEAQEPEESQHTKDIRTLKTAERVMEQIAQRARNATSEERAEIKSEMEALISVLGREAAAL